MSQSEARGGGHRAEGMRDTSESETREMVIWVCEFEGDFDINKAVKQSRSSAETSSDWLCM